MAILSKRNKLASEKNMQDHEIIRQFQAGDFRAFDLLVQRHQVATVNLCYQFLHDTEDARDVTQEIFIKVYHHLGRFKPDAQFATWLYRITVNSCLNALRSRRRRRWLRPFSSRELRQDTDVANIADPGANPESMLEKSERRAAVEKALDKLPVDQRTAIILHRYQGLSYKEIAAIMNTSIAAVEARIHRARKKLGRLLEKFLVNN